MAPSGMALTGDDRDAAPIRVLIVDDSPSMRQLIRLVLETDPAFDIVAEAGSARQARDAVNTLAPDVMTLDVEMPHMDGLEFLRRLMQARPMPVVMVSTLTEQGSEAAVRALSLGAVDCVQKPRAGKSGEAFSRLPEILRVAARARVTGSRPRKQVPAPVSAAAPWNGRMVLIGASTGGVEALETVLGALPATSPPILITQHMPHQFLLSFAARLNRQVAPSVRVAENGDAIRPGRILIAPGGAHHMVLDPGGRTRVLLRDGPKQAGHRPSVDVLFASALPRAADTVAVILTGMGADGADGMRQLHDAGAHCVAQDRDSAVVYGMPRVAVERGGVDQSLPLSAIAGHILTVTTEPVSSGAGRAPA